MAKLTVLVSALMCVTCFTAAMGQYKPSTASKDLRPGDIPVTKPGSYAEAGKTYVLTNDISSPGSAIFLGKDVTLDLNGYTITYADGKYEHVPNGGFEEGLKDWDVSKAPGAKVEETIKVKPFIGKSILRLPVGQEIVSKPITLPVANRTYYAMCGVLMSEMKVTVSVEDAAGKPVVVQTKLPQKDIQTCPVTGNTNMGGGFVFAYLHGLPAGQYRIRVKAEGVKENKEQTDCLIDEVDIRPAIDVGIGIVGQVYPDASFENSLTIDHAAFVDFADPNDSSKPIASIPQLTGKGTVTIRNGVIKDGAKSICTWGLLSTAPGVKLVLDNVKFVQSGIDAVALETASASIKNCRFETDMPFVVNRHKWTNVPVSVVDADGSEISNCEFIGGQGNLNIRGKGAIVHDNLFVNRQAVTNHYSVGVGLASDCKIYNNRFEPEIGSCLEFYRARNNDVYGNTFNVTAADGNCEYTHEDYSTNAIRITDYNAPLGSPDGADGNKVHNNKFIITGKHYTTYKGSVSLATAIFVSVGAGQNYIYDNDVTVNHKDVNSSSCAYAFYIGTSNTGGEFRHNKVVTNVPAFWISSFYGSASNVKVIENTIVKAKDAPADFKPFKLGFWNRPAVKVEFIGNKFENCEFGIENGLTEGDGKNEYTVK